MADLFWPGDHRAGQLMSDAAFLDALVRVENAWLNCLLDAGVAPEQARTDLAGLISAADSDAVAVAAERDGSPVTALVAVLRERADPVAARWLHRGLTSQDVVDTALVLCLRDALEAICSDLGAQIRTLAGLTRTHRDAPMLARTLTQPALPSTAGLKFAHWLTAVLDAADTLKALPPLPVQCGGAVGTLAAATELTGSAEGAVALADSLARALGLAAAPPWHTTRGVLTRTADALVDCCDAWGHVAGDVATGTRFEVGEFAEGAAGGSSTMPHKNNPVLTVLLRRTALTAPSLAATLHTASAASVDERADGGWHAEWATMRTLVRQTVSAAAHAVDLLSGLRFDAERAAANLAAVNGLLAEQKAMAELTQKPPAPTYLGATSRIIDSVLARAASHLEETS